MIKLNKWVAKNKVISMILFNAFEIVGYSVFFHLLNQPVWLIVVIDVLLVFINYMFISTVNNTLLKKPLEVLSKCGDPEPLLRETQELLTYKDTERNKQSLLITHCGALREFGELEKVSQILMSINIDKCSGTLPVTKAIYYNNLSDICNLLGDYKQADVWYSKMMQIYNDMNSGKFKDALNNMVLIATAESCYRKGEFGQAVSLLSQIKTDDLQLKIDIALLYAKIAIDVNDHESARSNLTYVINFGNKLYAVRVARQLLDTL